MSVRSKYADISLQQYWSWSKQATHILNYPDRTESALCFKLSRRSITLSSRVKACRSLYLVIHSCRVTLARSLSTTRVRKPFVITVSFSFWQGRWISIELYLKLICPHSASIRNTASCSNHVVWKKKFVRISIRLKQLNHKAMTYDFMGSGVWFHYQIKRWDPHPSIYD